MTRSYTKQYTSRNTKQLTTPGEAPGAQRTRKHAARFLAWHCVVLEKSTGKLPTFWPIDVEQMMVDEVDAEMILRLKLGSPQMSTLW